MLGLLNPWVILGLVLAFAGVGIKGYWMGQDAAKAEWAAASMKEQTTAERIRGAIKEEGQEIARGVEDGIGKIRVVHKTVNQVVKKEIEVHHVLIDPKCTYPPSTVKALNDARAGVIKSATGDRVRITSGAAENTARSAGRKPDGEVPATRPAN